MVINLNEEKLKGDLIEIWEKYIKNPNDKENINKAREIYSKYGEAAAFILQKKLIRPVIALVDISWNTGVKINKEKAKDILNELKK